MLAVLGTAFWEVNFKEIHSQFHHYKIVNFIGANKHVRVTILTCILTVQTCNSH